MPLDKVLPVARAFSQFLNLANIAEQHHRIRRRREYLRVHGSQPQRGSCEETFARLVQAGVTPDALHEALTMPAAEQRERMASLRLVVRQYNVYRWAGRMLIDAGRRRQRQRIEARVLRHSTR